MQSCDISVNSKQKSHLLSQICIENEGRGRLKKRRKGRTNKEKRSAIKILWEKREQDSGFICCPVTAGRNCSQFCLVIRYSPLYLTVLRGTGFQLTQIPFSNPITNIMRRTFAHPISPLPLLLFCSTECWLDEERGFWLDDEVWRLQMRKTAPVRGDKENKKHKQKWLRDARQHP